MKSYLIIASDLPALEGRPLKARDVFDLMHKHRCWEFPPTSQQAKLREGDLLLFYLGSKVRHIVGEATVAGAATPIERDSPVTFDRSRFPFFAWRMPLVDFVLYPSDKADLDLLMRLSFAQGGKVTRPYIGLLLRVGMRPLTAEDVTLVRKVANSAESTLSENCPMDTTRFLGPPDLHILVKFGGTKKSVDSPQSTVDRGQQRWLHHSGDGVGMGKTCQR